MALLWGLRSRALGNPLEGVSEPKVPRRERLLTRGEVGALLKAIKKASANAAKKTATRSKKRTKEALNAVALAAIEAAIHTGARISEILSLRWEEVRQDEMELHLRDTKTGFSRRQISPEALAAINKVERRPGCPYVFYSPRNPTRPIEYKLVRRTFKQIALEAGVSNCTLHTVRHWFSTITANTVSNPRVGMALTGHKSHAAYMTYVHGEKEQAKALAEQIGIFTRSLIDERESRKVAALRKATQ
jgi:integrase